MFIKHGSLLYEEKFVAWRSSSRRSAARRSADPVEIVSLGFGFRLGVGSLAFIRPLFHPVPLA